MKTRAEILEIINNYVVNEKDRYILIRRLVDGATYPVIAEEMGVADADPLGNSIGKRCRRAKARIADRLAE